MSDAFVPVDLDKLLDDFEEQDSSTSVSSRTQSAAQNEGNSNNSHSTNDCRMGEQLGFSSSKTISVKDAATKTNPDVVLGNSNENCGLVSHVTTDLFHNYEANSSKPVVDLLSTGVNTCDNSLSRFTPEKQSEHNTGSKGENSQCVPSSEMVNLLDLTDIEVTSRPSIPNGVDLLVNVALQPDPAPPDITNGTANKAESQSDVGVGNVPNNLQQDLLLLDIDDGIDNCNSSKPCSDKILSGNMTNKNILDSFQPSDSSLLDMPLDGSSQKDGENSLIDLTTEDSRPPVPVSLVNSSSTNVCPAESTSERLNKSSYEGANKRNDFNKQRSNCVVPDASSETSLGNQTLTNTSAPVCLSNTEDITGVTGTYSNSIDASTSEGNSTTGNITSTSTAMSSMPHLTDDGESNLLFLQDHFGNYGLARDIVDNNDNSLTSVNNESNSQGINSSESTEVMNDRQQTTEDSIPVAQDAVNENTENDEPLSVVNNNELHESEQPGQLGYTAPQWLPDSEVNRCMNCQCKFTVVKRRHHCRACGKIYCSSCCNLKFNLQYLEDKLARVCQTCANILLQRQAALSNQNSLMNDNDDAGMYLYLNPNDQPHAPVEPNVEDVASEAEQPPEYEETEVQPSIEPSVPGEFSSGVSVFEGGDAMTESSSQVRQFRPSTYSSSSSVSSTDIPVTSTIPLPPVLIKTDEGLKINESPNHQELLYNLKKKKETVMFLLNKHLVVRVKIVKLNCCVKRKCWCFSSEGMQAADQEDMVILLECVSKESSIPQDVLSHFNTAFRYAKEGHRVTDLGYTIFGQPFLGSLRNAGFLYVNSSFQCLENLVLPSGPYIFGILIQREEVSWVQLFPIRLILRLGAEYRYYPCPLWSVRDRQPMYGEIGHTIMDLLADFKNFQYTLPRVTGMHVHLEDKKVVIQLPQNRYDETRTFLDIDHESKYLYPKPGFSKVLKVLNATDEYVMAFEATFSNVADSHLVCIQEGTTYKTQSINLDGQERKVTGASFIVFNGALKSTTDVKAKISIVEDGVMVQMIKQLSEEMRQSMREMSDFTIHTGLPDTDDTSIKQVVFEWVSKRNPDAQSVLSPIDGLTLGTTSDIKINTHFDFSTPSIFRLRWTELFFLNRSGDRPTRTLPAQFKQTTADIAKACTVALRPYLYTLYQMDKRRIGLRVDLSPDMVGYVIGSQGSPLPNETANNLDNELVPAINSAVNPSSSTPSSMEFLFNIVEMLS